MLSLGTYLQADVMHLSNALLLANAAYTAVCSPLRSVAGSKCARAPFDLEGYAKVNPIGPTTGGEGGEEIHVSNSDELLDAIEGNEPAVIYVDGPIELSSRAKFGSNKSLIGVGADAHITKSGITIEDQDNVVIRNLKISYILGQDSISINNSTRVWIDHNEFESELSLEVGSDTYVRNILLWTVVEVGLTMYEGRPDRYRSRLGLDHHIMELSP